MMNFLQHRIQTYCAFCRSPRRVYKQKRAGWFEFAVAAFGAGIMMFLFFGGLDARAIFIFVFMAGAADLFVQLRWRLTASCPHCGFDPVLYMKDHSQAAAKVKVHLEKRKNDPMTVLSRPLNLPVRKISAGERLRKGQNLSREV